MKEISLKDLVKMKQAGCEIFDEAGKEYDPEKVLKDRDLSIILQKALKVLEEQQRARWKFTIFRDRNTGLISEVLADRSGPAKVS